LIRRSRYEQLPVIGSVPFHRINAIYVLECWDNKSKSKSKSGSLSGEEKYRVRRGDYRILYEINDALITIVVVRIAHCGDIYRH